MNSVEGNTLPEGWRQVKISDVSEFIRGISFKTSDAKNNYEDGLVGVYRTKNIQETLTFDDVYFLTKEHIRNNNKYLKKGDILISSANSLELLGKCCRYIQMDYPASLGGFISCARVNSLMNADFFYYFFASDFNQTKMRGLANKTTGIANLPLKSVSELPIPLPPLEEQKRIVAKIETLFTKIDKAISLTQESLKQAKNLLPRIIDETVDSFDAEKVDLKSVSTSIQYGYTGKTIENGQYYYLRITDIQGGIVNYENTPYSDIEGKDIEKYKLNKGDILFARTGATAGKSYLFNDDVEAVFASYLIRVVCNQDIVNPSFVKWFFLSTNYWRQIFGNIVGAAQPNFNGKKLGELSLKIPSMEQQEFTVGYLNKVSRQTKNTQFKLEEQLDYLKQLKSSILSKAFKGEL